MKTFTGAHPNRKRYRLALAGVLLLVAMPAWFGNARRGGKASRRHWRGGRPVRGQGRDLRRHRIDWGPLR